MQTVECLVELPPPAPVKMDKLSSGPQRDNSKEDKSGEGSKNKDVTTAPSTSGAEMESEETDERAVSRVNSDPGEGGIDIEVTEYDDDAEEVDEDEEPQILDIEGQSALILHMLQNTEDDKYSHIKLAKLMHPSESGVNLLETPSMREFADEGAKREMYEAIYGRMKTKKSSQATEAGESGGPPPPKNLYEALQSGLLRSNTKTNIYRLVTTGTHSENQESLIEWIRDLIEDINQHCYTETLTGVLILFPNHFIHVVEGSEDTLVKFIRCAADQFEPNGYDWKLEFTPDTGTIKVRDPILFTTVKTYVIGMFKLLHRGIASGWKTERVVQTPVSDQDIPKGGFRQKLFEFTKMSCITAIAVNKLTPIRNTSGKDSITLTAQDLEDAKEKYEEAKRRRSQAMAKILPKTPFIDYIIRKSPSRKMQLRNLREHLEHFWKTPHIVLPQQTDYPVPGKLAPYD